MKVKQSDLITSILGEDIFQVLKKSEISGGLYKPGTRTALDPNEMRIALEIVPRTILSFLMSKLKDKKDGEICSIDLPFAPGATLSCHKLGPDNYSGDIVQNGKKMVEFKHRSIPGIGLQILTTFELYDLSELDKAPEANKETEIRVDKLQSIIDERLKLHSLIQDVVDKRLTERQAIQSMISEKLASHIEAKQAEPVKELEESEIQKEDAEMSKKSRLRSFLENREKKRQAAVEMDKSEVNCPDCSGNLYKSENKNKITLCVCYGEDFNKEIKFEKKEDGKVRFKFPKSFDIDNVEMLLSALKNKGIEEN